MLSAGCKFAYACTILYHYDQEQTLFSCPSYSIYLVSKFVLCSVLCINLVAKPGVSGIDPGIPKEGISEVGNQASSTPYCWGLFFFFYFFLFASFYFLFLFHLFLFFFQTELHVVRQSGDEV